MYDICTYVPFTLQLKTTRIMFEQQAILKLVDLSRLVMNSAAGMFNKSLPSPDRSKLVNTAGFDAGIDLQSQDQAILSNAQLCLLDVCSLDGNL